MVSENKFIAIGRLAGDAIIRTTQNNTEVASYTLVTNQKYKDKTGNWQERATFIPMVTFAPTQALKDKLTKGQPFYVEGELRNTEYEKDGNKVYGMNVVTVKCFHINTGTNGSAAKSNNDNQAPVEEASTVSGFVDANDDLPF